MKAVKQMTVWIFSDPAKLYLVNQDKANPVSKLKDFISSSFKLPEENYILANLMPGAPYPIPVMRFASELDSGIVLCLPKKNINVKIQIRDEEPFISSINPLRSIGDLKAVIAKEKGYAMAQQELLYNGHALPNQGLILDHGIYDGSKLHLLLQPARPFCISVETFWGESYSIETDPCMPVQDVQKGVLRKTFSANLQSVETLQNQNCYNHLIQCLHQDTILLKKSCVNYCGVRKGTTMALSLTSETRRDANKSVHIQVAETEEKFEVQVSVYDTWFIVALKAHGLLKTPIDEMTFKIQDKTLDLHDTLGSLKPMKQEFADCISIMLFTTKKEEEESESLTLNTVFPSGLKESFTLSPLTTVKDVKKVIQSYGHVNAQYYDLYYKRVKLPQNTKLNDYKLPEKNVIELKLGDFPVLLQDGTTSKKLTANLDLQVTNMMQKIEEITNCSSLTTCALFTGEDLYYHEGGTIVSTPLYINSRLFLETVPYNQTLHLVTDEQVIPLPKKQHLDSLHLQHLSASCANLDRFVEALQWFTKWRFPERSVLRSASSRESSRLGKPVLKYNSSAPSGNYKHGMPNFNALPKSPRESNGRESVSSNPPSTPDSAADSLIKPTHMIGFRGSPIVLHKRDYAAVRNKPASGSPESKLARSKVMSGSAMFPALPARHKSPRHHTSVPDGLHHEKPKSLLRGDNYSGRKNLSVRFDLPESEQEKADDSCHIPQRGGRFNAGNFWKGSKQFLGSRIERRGSDAFSGHERRHSGLIRMTSDLSLTGIRQDRPFPTTEMFKNTSSLHARMGSKYFDRQRGTSSRATTVNGDPFAAPAYTRSHTMSRF